jgi:hypothetical protein
VTQPLTDEATAYHEAGHAVAALALGRPVDRVSIRPDRDKVGVCAFRKPVFRPSEDWVEREMLIALAGIAAEARHTGEYAWDGADRDYRYAYELALDCAGARRQAERLVKRVLSKVEHLLSREVNWRTVTRVVEELLRRREISGRAARSLFEQSQRENE